MRRLIIGLVLLGGLGLGADIGAKTWAAGQIETRAKAELPAQVGVSANISAFPFLLPLFLAGKVSEADGHFTNVPAGAITLDRVDIELRGVKINRHKLISERTVELVKIDSGTVSVEILSATLSKLLGNVPVTIENGEVRVAGVRAGTVRVDRNALVIAAGAVSQRVPIPKTRLVPCVAGVTILAGRVRLSCTIHDVPKGMLGAANARLGP